MDGPETSTSGGDKSGGEGSQGAKKVRRALKNARSLISELFAREKSGRQVRRPKSVTHDLSKSEIQPAGKTGGDGHRSIAQNYREGESDSDDDNDWESDFNGPYSCKAARTQKTALDTLSTIDEDSDWDEVDRGENLLKTFDDQAAMVQPGLFIGAFLAEQNKDELEKKGITHILQVGDNLTQSFEGEFEYCTITVADTETACLLVFFRECFEFIEEAKESGGGVLVHCFAGISRSATICISYLMWKLSLSLGAAHFMVESARPCTQPNDGFKAQLQMFESLGCDLDRLEQWHEQQMSNVQHLSSDEFDI